MKKILSVILIAFFMAYVLTACQELAVEKSQPVEVKYTAACDKVETETVYKYNWLANEFVLVPDTHTVHYYEVRYNITYSDGSTASEWREVDKDTYESIKDELPPGGGFY
ncbi:MAG: hypothetical protein ACI4RF_05425 [Eubacterium sp.]